MKSTMKSAFAIIAVALMIMVAVVPMVGVFTEDSSATTAVDPTVSGTGVTINVVVYDTSGSSITSGDNLVKLTYKAGNNNYTMTAEMSGSISFIAQEKEISNVVLTYVDKDGVAVPGYGTASLGALTTGTYAASIVAGLKSEPLVFNFKNGITDIMGALPTGATMSGTYDVYTNTADDASTATVYQTRQSIDSTGTTTVYYPVSASHVYVKVTSLSVSGTGVASGAITYTTPTTPVKISSSDAVKVNENLIEVELASAFNLNSVVLTVNGITTEGVTYKKISDKMQNRSAATTAKFTTTSDVPTEASNVTISLTAPDNTTQTAGAVTISGSKFTFAPATTDNKAFFGTVYMSAAAYWQTGTLNMKFTTSTVRERNAVVGENGEFFTFISDAAADTKIKEMTFKSGSQTYQLATPIGAEGLEIDFDGTTVSLSSTGYSAVSGNLYKVSTMDGIVGKTMAVSSGVKTFGQLVTGTNGAFAFMAEAGKNTSLKPTDSVVYTGNVNITVGSGSSYAVYMATQDITLKVADALGNALTGAAVTLTDGTSTIATFAAGTVDGTYKATIRGDLKPTDYKVYISDPSGYTYTNATAETAVAFVEGSTYKALEAQYSITVYENDGVTEISTTAYDVYAAKAYKNSLGSIVYTYDSPISVSSGDFIANASMIAVKESDIGATPVDVILMVTQATIQDQGIFKTYYVLNADDEGAISIVASEDSLTGKLTRNDGVTGIAGIKAVLNDGSNDVYTTYTQADGSFTVYSDLTIGSRYVMKFTDAGNYTFTAAGYSVYTGAVRNSTFVAATSAYTISLVDADGAKIMLADSAKFKVGSVEFTAVNGTNTATATAGWTATSGKDLVISEFVAADAKDATARSFEDVTLSATELATGQITLVSNQSTYTFNVTDSAGKALSGATVQFYKYVGDYAEIISTATATTDTYGVATYLLPIATEKDLDTVYGYGLSTTATGYAFATGVTKITAASNDVKSLTASKTIYLQDAAGVALTGTPASVTIVADGVESAGTPKAGYFTYLETEGVTYKFTVGTIPISGTPTYSFVAKQAAVDGVIKAKQETIVGSVTDAVGNFTGMEATVTAKYTDGSTKTGTQGQNDVAYKIIADVSEIEYYTVTMTGYTFENSLTPEIKANETKLAITLETANGVIVFDEDTARASVTQVYAMYKTGAYSSVFNVTGGYIIVNTDLVDYFMTNVATGTYAGDYISTDGAFVSTIAYYTGSVGDASVTSGSVIAELYDGSTLVDRKSVSFTDGKYVVTADLSLGDKVIVTYTDADSGSVYTAVMSNTAAYNNLQLVVVADDLKAKIIGGAEYGSTDSGYFTYTLSTDKSKIYLMAINSYNLAVSVDDSGTTVNNLVAKYVFAGWYVNGEKVTKDLAYTVDNLDSNVVMALYEFDGYYEVDKPVSSNNGIDPTVLVIGIAAVIIALIAVVYTVIQKKE